ncbi:hypothetical protein C1752_00807 [Acaryochloris thomasi RCC1774]|uniref:Proteasome-type protease n=1 Tax=Acaryochloris thomasi RCC1774 TaxID=1764569 RepID=A0A2W1JNB1_9CYAN|nr:proteasome-type protease [Acaryochloris thomasi]PZD74706.1 hypothetical protein C1752_00807 [Acaryochloris thomasi RCC1774]
MTYCLGIKTHFGLVMAADSLTNAGVDYVSKVQKLFDFSRPGERVILISNAGNLSMTQNVLTLVRRDIKNQAENDIYDLPTMFEVAQYLGKRVRDVADQNRNWMQQDKIDFSCSFLLGGQIKGEAPELYMIYSQGNFLRATKETPYLQIGEIKYGKPILDRTISYETQLDDAAKCALLSLDSTMKSNISVGPPINMVMYETDSLEIVHQVKFFDADPYLNKIRQSWEQSVKQAFQQLPSPDWQRVDTREQEDNWLSPSNIIPD